MSAPLKHMTAAQIRGRLEEISQAEAARAARDMDAELAQIMRNGGDIDALEAAQIEAERASRRLRVERAALEADLPLAIKREGAASLSALSDTHRGLAGNAEKLVDELCAAWSCFETALKAWEANQAEAVKLTEEAYRLSQQSSADMPMMGNFLSARLVEVAKSAQWLSNRFISAESQMQVGYGVQAHRLD